MTVAVTALAFVVVSATPSWAAPPSNDDFADAQVETASFTDSLSNAEATTEAGEPAFSACTFLNFPAVKTVWYGLTVTTGTEISVSTVGSDYDTILAAYTGAAVGSLSEVACNDDADGFASLMEFTASSSTTYWIQVAGVGGSGAGDTGNLALDVTVTPPPSGADVSVSVADSADPVSLGGDNVTYTLSVANGGPSGATGVTADTTFSGASVGIVSATASQGSCTISAPDVDCSLGSIAVSGSATVTITVTPAATGTITATATVDATESDPDGGDNSDAENTTVNNGLGCTITGTNGPDTLNGTNGADVICGLGGNDDITGGNNNDTVYAGPGNDTLVGGNGADTLYGQAGNDNTYGESLLEALLGLFDNGADIIDGGPGNDDLDGQNGTDTLTDHNGTDTMSGNLGNDTINVQDGVAGDTANGGLGSDTCTVDAGDTNNC